MNFNHFKKLFKINTSGGHLSSSNFSLSDALTSPDKYVSGLLALKHTGPPNSDEVHVKIQLSNSFVNRDVYLSSRIYLTFVLLFM